MRNKQVEFNPYIYTLSKLSRFGYEISVFKYTTGRYSEQPGRYSEQPAHTSRLSLHGKMDVKICLMFIVTENTRSINIEQSCADIHVTRVLLFQKNFSTKCLHVSNKKKTTWFCHVILVAIHMHYNNIGKGYQRSYHLSRFQYSMST